MRRVSMQDAASLFGTSGTAAEQLDALRSLAQNKTLQQASRTELFTTGLHRLAQVTTASDPKQRLHALSALGRIWSSLKPQRPAVEATLSRSEIAEPAALATLPEPDDRAYAALACRYVLASWARQYLATAAAGEDAAENVRADCLDSLLTITGDLRDTFALLRGRLAALSFVTERPSDSMGRRVRRLLLSVHRTVPSHTTITAEAAGRELAALLYDSFRTVGTPSHEPLKKEIAVAAAQIVHDIVRVRFSQATDPATYEVLDVLYRWFRPHAWEELADAVPALRAVADDILEAVRLLARAGVTDARMRASLVLAVGSEERARVRLKTVAETAPGITLEVRDWLTGTESTPVLDAVEESGLRSLDQVIADLLVRRNDIERLATATTGEGSDDRALVRTLADSFMHMANARGLELQYVIGDVVEYSPLDHELIGGPRHGVRRVRVVQPQVRAREVTGRFRVVRKALVEAVTSP